MLKSADALLRSVPGKAVLYRMEKLIGLSIRASDGELGKVRDVYFDDHRWTARYLVVDTGGWLQARRVLISPISIETIDWDLRSAPVKLSRQQVEASPEIDTDKPVLRQQELDLLGYYGYPRYWGGPLAWGTTSYPYSMSPTMLIPTVNGIHTGYTSAPDEPQLHGARAVRSYHLQTANASIGDVEDFLIDDESWAMRYIVVCTRDWWPGHHVLISPQWITGVDWAQKRVTVDVTRDTLQRATEYDPAIDHSRAHEASLYRHYEQPDHWLVPVHGPPR